MKLEDVVIFRWNSEHADAFRTYAQKKGMYPSQLLRNLLDSYLSRLGLICNHSKLDSACSLR